MLWFVLTFEGNSRQCSKNIQLTVIDDTLRNFYESYKCAFKFYLPHKLGKYVILFRCMTDTSDRYV